jgi:hypothetical protein
LAELPAGDPFEAVLAGLEQHLLERETACGLGVGSLGDRRAGGAQTLDQLVADLLELSEVEQSRSPPGMPLSLLEAAHRKCGHERVGELALERDDLSAEGSPGRALLVVDDRRASPGGRVRCLRAAGCLCKQLHPRLQPVASPAYHRDHAGPTGYRGRPRRF